MVLLLNLLLLLIVIVGGLCYWKWRKPWIVAVTVLIVLVYTMAQPSYLPKGQVERTELLPFEQKELVAEDRLLKAPTGDEMDSRRNQMIKEGLPFGDPTM